MNTFGYFLGISKQTEVLFLILLGICCTIFDASLFNLNSNLYKVWEMPMDPGKFTDTAQLYVKYILSTIVLVRTFTVHLYLAFYIVMLWPAIFEERPGLLLPWLIVGAIKCLAMGAMSLSTGLYICLSYTFSKPACWDFLIAQVIDQGPSVYMWCCVLSYYRDLKIFAISDYRFRQTPSAVFGLAERRRRARSLFANSKFENSFNDQRQLISVSTIDNIINQLNISLHRGTSRSLDSLLDLMAAEAEKDEIFEMNDETIDVDETLTVAEKTAKLLKLTPSYIDKVKNKSESATNAFLEKQIRHQHTYPLLKKSLSDIRRKPKVSKKPSEDLSQIPSEMELRIIGLCDSFEKMRQSATLSPQCTSKNKMNILISKFGPTKEDNNIQVSSDDGNFKSDFRDITKVSTLSQVSSPIENTTPQLLQIPVDIGSKYELQEKLWSPKGCTSASTVTSQEKEIPKATVATQKSEIDIVHKSDLELVPKRVVSIVASVKTKTKDSADAKEAEIKESLKQIEIKQPPKKTSESPLKTEMKEASKKIENANKTDIAEVPEPGAPMTKSEMREINPSSLPKIIKSTSFSSKPDTVAKKISLVAVNLKSKQDEVKIGAPLVLPPAQVIIQTRQGLQPKSSPTIAANDIPQPPKSKSQPKTDFIMAVSQPPSFKYDGYTLEYMEKQRKLSAKDPKKRPCSSGV